MPGKRGTPEERFWSKVAKKGPDDCWLWLACSWGEYGGFYDGTKQRGAHQFSLEQKLGRKLRKGECALHTCDNKRCVNPKHLFAGTNLDNSRDMVRKGRKERGEDVYGAVFTQMDILAIRNKFATGRYTLKSLGEEYGVDSSHISYIVRGLIWKHVGGPIYKGKLKLGPQKPQGPRRHLKGKRVGRLTVLHYIRIKGAKPEIQWLCQCDCGNKITLATSVLTNKRQPTKSCGCRRKEMLASGGTTKWSKDRY